MGGQRRFAYSYGTQTAPKGSVEYEQWVTWKAHTAEDSGFHKFEFRHEIEFGLTDRLQLGLYLADWEIEESAEGHESKYEKSAVELIYSLSDPAADWLGSALYFEAGAGPDVIELEAKLLLQKDFGPVSAVYNFVLEAEWEGNDFEERTGEIQNIFGLSYQITPALSVGIEALHEIAFDDWSDAGDHVSYLGPNLSWRHGSFFAVIAPLFQVTDVDDEPDFSTRLIAGFSF
jgi:hypothetical protein